MTTEWATAISLDIEFSAHGLATSLSKLLKEDWYLAGADEEDERYGLVQLKSKSLDYQLLTNGKLLLFSSTIDWARFFGFESRREGMLADFKTVACNLGNGDLFVYPDNACALGLLWSDDAMAVTLQDVALLLKQLYGPPEPTFSAIERAFNEGTLTNQDFYFDQNTR